MEQLKTERLWIRPIQSDDVEAIHEYAGDKGITMMLFLPNETMEETKEFVSYAVSKWRQADPDDREFVLVMGDKIVGGMDLEYVDSKDVCEIGWTIHKDYRNQGIATEAAKMLIDYAFRVMKVEKVIARCDSKNAASEQVMRKLGMTLVDDKGTRTYAKTGVTSGEYTYAIEKAHKM
ncbi:MAG: GNAT family N-acetyltransferase [Roseburia sp.]